MRKNIIILLSFIQFSLLFGQKAEDFLGKALDEVNKYKNSSLDDIQNKIALEIMKKSLNDMVEKQLENVSIEETQKEQLKNLLKMVQDMTIDTATKNKDLMKAISDSMKLSTDSSETPTSTNSEANANEKISDSMDSVFKNKVRDFLEGKESDMKDFTSSLVKNYLKDNNTEKSLADTIIANKENLKKVFEDKEFQQKLKDMASDFTKNSGKILGQDNTAKVEELKSDKGDQDFYMGFWVAISAFCIVLVIFFGIRRYLKSRQLRSELNQYGYVMPTD